MSYSDFILYYDEQYIYQAVVIEGPEFKGTRKTGNIVLWIYSEYSTI